MFCKYCGKEIKDDALFCNKCGKQLQVAKNLTSKEENGKDITIDKVEDRKESTTESSQIISNNKEEVKEGSKISIKRALCIGVPVLAILLGAGIYFIVSNGGINKIKGIEEVYETDNMEATDDENEQAIKEDTTDTISMVEEAKKTDSTENDFIEKLGKKTPDGDEDEPVEEIEITDNLISEDVLRDVIDKYEVFYSEHYSPNNSCVKLDYLNSDGIPEMIVRYDDVIDVFEYVDGTVCAVAAFLEDENNFLFSKVDSKIILSGATDHGWLYVYDISPSGPKYIEGMHSLVDYNTGATNYFAVDANKNIISQVTPDEFAQFRNRNDDTNYIIYRLSNKTFSNTLDAYNSLVGVNAEDENRIKGAKVAKVPILSAEASSTLDVKSKDGMSYLASNIFDGSVKTSWSEGAEGLGVNETIEIELDGVHEISTLKFYNGFLKTKRRYAINGKISKMQIDYGNGFVQVVNPTVMDVDEEEVMFAIDELGATIITPPVKCITNKIVLTILEAEPGSEYNDVGISEIEVFGR